MVPVNDPNREAKAADGTASFLCSSGDQSDIACSHDDTVSAPPPPNISATKRTAPSGTYSLGPGDLLGDYLLEGRLGRGGMGEVYRALHIRLDRRVALKVIAPGQIASEPAVARFYHEMRAVGRLDHPHLVRATDARRVGPWHVLVMELLDGLDVGRLLRRLGRAPVADACEIARQAAEGLAHAHAHCLVHRDVKPSNLMLSRGGTVKVLDLGLVRFQEAAPGLTADGTAMGTPDYVSPEQVDDPRGATPRSDLYSLGCTLYHLLAGRPPFHDSDSPFEKMLRHRTAPVPPLQERRPELPTSLVALLERLMAKEPAARPASAGEVAEGLRPWCVGADLSGLLERSLAVEPRNGSLELAEDRVSSTTARPVPEPGGHAAPPATAERPAPPRPNPAPGRARPRNRFAVTSALAVLAITGVIAGLAVFGGREPPRPDLRGSIDLVVYEAAATGDEFVPGDPARQGLRLRDHRALPLGPRDWVRIEAKVSRPSYLYVVWIDTDGRATPLWPWLDGAWDRRPSSEKPRDRLSIPDPDGGHDIMPLSGGAPGVEALLLLARETRLGPAENEEVQRALSQLRPRQARAGDEAAFVLLKDGERVDEELTRAPIPPKAGSSGDHEVQVSRAMKQLRKIFPTTYAACFGNRGVR
jgi:serine/threonine protein kinase